MAAHDVEAPYLSGEAGRKRAQPGQAPVAPPVHVAAVDLDDSLTRAGGHSAWNEGDVLPLLGGATVVHTPGHTPGSISLHFPNEGVLLVADALQRYQGRLTLPSRWFSSDMEAAKESVRPPVPTGLRGALLQPLRTHAPGCSGGASAHSRSGFRDLACTQLPGTVI